jgi:hypothetical protein
MISPPDTEHLGLQTTLPEKESGKKNIHILLDGTSSSGKSTISKFFIDDGYFHINFDNYAEAGDIEFIKTVGNNYDDGKLNYTRKLMFEEAQKHKLVLYDDIYQKITSFYKKRSDLFIIVVYTSLSQLVDNMHSRRFTSRRGLFVFDQYSSRYITTEANDFIDKISKPTFINKLKEKMKYEFDSEDDLIKFANETFQQIGITDDKEHGIKLRDSFEYDYLVKTDGREPKDIFVELQKIVSKNYKIK